MPREIQIATAFRAFHETLGYCFAMCNDEGLALLSMSLNYEFRITVTV